MDAMTALKEILKLAYKHEVQYWLDAPGTDAEKLARIVRICREAIPAEDGPSARLISSRQTR